MTRHFKVAVRFCFHIYGLPTLCILSFCIDKNASCCTYLLPSCKLRCIWYYRSDSIHTSTYSGTDVRDVLHGHEFLSHPFAISVFGNFVYWSDWRTNSLVRVSWISSLFTCDMQVTSWLKRQLQCAWLLMFVLLLCREAWLYHRVCSNWKCIIV